MNVLYEDDFLKVTIKDIFQNTYDTPVELLVVFTGIGFGVGGVDVQKEEFTKGDFSGDIIFVFDKKRSWGNFLDFDALKLIIYPFFEGKKVYYLGNSLGGFNAIIFSRFLKPNSVLAFVPQYSVSKKVIPKENRWDRYVDDIKEFRFESLEGFFSELVEYYVFTGDNFKEKRHWMRMPKSSNVNVFVLKGVGHQCAKVLRDAGCLYELIESCFYKNNQCADILNEKGVEFIRHKDIL